jgi:phage terminase large subunit-like protein
VHTRAYWKGEVEVDGEVRQVRRADAGRDAGGPQGQVDLASVLRDLLPQGADAGALTAFRSWDADSQRRALDLALSGNAKGYRKFYCPATDCDGEPHDPWSWRHARADQHPPKATEDWFVWLMQGGRGSGKTRAGAEYVHRATAICGRIALVGPTGADLRDIMVEGESGLLATAAPGQMPHWEPSKRRLTWPNGTLATTYSGEEPDRLRGPQHHLAWIDEPAHMPFIETVWSNLLLGLRLGRFPRICATTTPTPIPWMRAVATDPLTRRVRVSTYANLANLAEPFKRTVLARYEGTRLGRQELHGEILEDVEGALWTWGLIEPHRVDAPPELDRIVVGIDPAGTARKRSDETGIVVAGIAHGELYILADGSGRMSPNRWATAALNLYDHWTADALVPEKNYGGDMVIQLLRSVDGMARIVPVHSRRGKQLRAEPVVSLYEQGKVHHVGSFPDLEDQMTTWVPGEGDSPDRVDALVHACTHLARAHAPALMASPAHLRVIQGGNR